MKISKILPASKGYSVLLCCIIAGAAVFIPRGINEYIVLSQSTSSRTLTMEKDGKTLLWGAGDRDSEGALWFDMTDATIDPNRFNHGIGADKIPSIDKPAFVTQGDPRYRRNGSKDGSRVIGVVVEGEARAYPIRIMNRHELVNDTFGDAHLTVAW